MRDWGQQLLRERFGERLERIARVLDVQGDSVDDESGPLELTFEGGRVVHLTRDPHSEFLSVREGPWEDRADDRRVRIDVSDRPGYAEAVKGHAVPEGAVAAIPEHVPASGAQPPAEPRVMGEPSLFGSTWLVNPDGCVAGVELRFFAATITFAIRGGGEYVVFGRAGALPREWGLQRWPDMTMEA